MKFMKHKRNSCILILAVLLLLLSGCGNNLQAEIDALSQTISQLRTDISEHEEVIEEQNQTIASKEQEITDLKAQITSLESENQQLTSNYNNAIQQFNSLSEHLSEVPERYKEIFFDTSEIRFVATFFNDDIRVVKIDESRNKIVDLLTDKDLEFRGIHNYIDGSYGYEFTMEEFLNCDVSINIGGKYYCLVGLPSSLQIQALDGKLCLYDICQALEIIRVQKAGQFVFDTSY